MDAAEGLKIALAKNSKGSKEAKEDSELKKEEKRHKIFIRFLNKAKNRGCELHKRIAEFKMKKKAQNK